MAICLPQLHLRSTYMTFLESADNYLGTAKMAMDDDCQTEPSNWGNIREASSSLFMVSNGQSLHCACC